MGESLDDWREFFRTTNTDLLEFIDTAITIAALDHPRDFRQQRDRITERLFTIKTTQSLRPKCDDDPPTPRDGGDYCARVGKERKRIRDSGRGDVECDGVDMNPESYHDFGGAEAFGDEINEESQVIGEVLRIKQVLDARGHESDFTLYESIRRLHSMTISVDILEKTKIGITVNNLQRKGGSTQIARLAHDITMGWKASVEDICHNTKDVADSYVDLRKVGIIDCASGPTSSVKNQRIHQHQATVKINSSGEVAVGKKFGASKRILREHCQQAETAKRQRTVLALPAFPKQPTSHNGLGRHGRIEKTLSQMAKSRRRISSF